LIARCCWTGQEQVTIDQGCFAACPAAAAGGAAVEGDGDGEDDEGDALLGIWSKYFLIDSW
jgi:hypothetical protein